MRILLLGKSGLLGSAIFEAISKTKNLCTALSKSECDVTVQNQIKSAIEKFAPDIIINATGYTKVDEAESNPGLAFAVNRDGVRNLALCVKKANIPLVHFSTDYVFNGLKKGGYTESDSPSPISVYGQSKAEGESEVVKNLEKFYLIRTAWLYGHAGPNFVNKLLFAVEKGQKVISVASDQRGCPTFANDVAQAVLGLIESKKYGIYHAVNDGDATRFEFATEIFHQLGISIQINPILSKDLQSAVVRPANSVLLNTKLPRLRHWKSALAEYLSTKQLII